VVATPHRTSTSLASMQHWRAEFSKADILAQLVAWIIKFAESYD